MAFIDRTDLEKYIEADDLDQIIDGDETIIDGAISDAEEFAAELIRQRYDIVAEYGEVGAARNRQLLKQVVAITLFYLAERLPTDVLPENRGLAFERAEEWLKDVGAGRRMCDLKAVDDENSVGHAIKYGNGTANGGNHY